MDIQKLRRDTLSFVRSNHLPQAGIGAYRYSSAASQATLYSSTYAAMIRSLYNDLHEISQEDRKKWVTYLNEYQDDDGLFCDPIIYDQGWYKGDPFWCGRPHLTCHVLTALTCLGGVAKRSFRMVKEFSSPKRSHGFGFVDRINWEAYNESGDLKPQVERYRKRFGFYPDSVHADKIYRTRENRQYCKANGIRLSGQPLGRPKIPTAENAEQLKREKKQIYQDEIDRIAVEGKFGQGKRRFSLDRIMTKLAGTSETVIMVVFLVMNLEKILAAAMSFLLRIWRRWDRIQIAAWRTACREGLIDNRHACQPMKIPAAAA